MRFLIITLIIFVSCNPRIPLYSPEVNFISKGAQGTITVSSIGFGKNKRDAIAQAQINSIRTLLFYGIPGSELNLPLVEEGISGEKKHSSFFNKFFKGGEYTNYIMSLDEIGETETIKRAKKVNVRIKVNYSSLRKVLENNSIIRKFGY